MKKDNKVSIIVGAICLIVCLLMISDWTAIKGGLQLIRATWLKILITVCLAAPFMGLISCVYLIVKGGKR